jgi:hypothetical protein
MAIDALLTCDAKAMAEEDESDHINSYVAAGMYHCGHSVQKDSILAEKSVLRMKEVGLSYCQATVLKFALEVGIDVLSSLIRLGVSPRDVNEQGLSMLDVAVLRLQGDTQKAVLTTLEHNGHM